MVEKIENDISGIKIPKQLQKEEFRFILINKESKRPIEEHWVTKNNYKYNDEKLLNWINHENNNYGVLCGVGNLVVLDIDNLSIINDLKNIIPDTFTIETGSGKKHFYFKTKERI